MQTKKNISVHPASSAFYYTPNIMENEWKNLSNTGYYTSPVALKRHMDAKYGRDAPSLAAIRTYMHAEPAYQLHQEIHRNRFVHEGEASRWIAVGGIPGFAFQLDVMYTNR
jgi:hypothetical protein